MAITVLQSKSGSTVASTNTHNITLDTNVGANHGIVVNTGVAANNTVSSVTDNQGNTYTQRANANSSFGAGSALWSCNATGSSGSLTITVTWSATNTFRKSISAIELNGPLTFDVKNNANGFSTTHSPGVITTTGADRIVVTLNSVSVSITGSPSGYTSINTQTASNGMAAMYRVFTSVQTNLNDGWTSGSNGAWCCCQAAFSVLTSIDEEVESVITFTQDIDCQLVISRPIDHTLTLTQDIEVEIVNNGLVEQTLPLTQDIQLELILERLVDQNLTFTQDVFLNIVSNQEVTSTLTLTHSFYQKLEIEDTLVFTQDVTFEKFKYEEVDDVITFTQDIDTNKVVNKLVNSNFVMANFVFMNKVIQKSVSNTLTFSQTQTGIASKAVISSLIYTQDIDVELAKRIVSTLVCTQSISRQVILNKTVLSHFNPYQQISRNILAFRPVTSTLNLTQTIVVDKVKDVHQTLTFTQTVDVICSKYVQSDLAFTETLEFNQVRNLELLHLYFFTQSITLEKAYLRTVPPSVLAFDQFIKVTKTYNLSVNHTLTLSQEIVRERFYLDVDQTLTLTQSLSKTRVDTITVSHNLNLNDSLSLNTSLSRAVTSNLIFLPYYTRPLSGIDVTFPNIIVGKSQRFTLIRGVGRFITLPNPIFGDGEGNTGIFTLRRGMRGKSYTYVKTTDFRKLAYTFHIPRIKAYELIDFVSECNSEVVQVENWKGEIWRVLIANNPTDFASVERYASEKEFDDQREKVEVRMEFEGFRLV